MYANRMLSAATLCLAVQAAFFVFAAAGDAGEAPVRQLTFSDFMPTLENHKNVLVEFYAPWCGHCKALEPEYKAAAERLKKEGVDCLLAKVDATAEDMLAGFFSVKAFPTIKFLVGPVARLCN